MHAQLGRCDDAVALLREAAALDPGQKWLSELRGDVWWWACRGREGFPVELLDGGDA
jgi:hypothetical protein